MVEKFERPNIYLSWVVYFRIGVMEVSPNKAENLYR